MKMEFLSKSPEETIEIGKQFSRQLVRSDVTALYGELGAGKTLFVKGVCEGLGVTETVSSPSFVVLNRYEAKNKRGNDLIVNHLDLYRVYSSDEIYDLGYEEIMYGDGICLIEWSERLNVLLPDKRYDVTFEITGENERLIKINDYSRH
jgi:tRNA threonylcarbamoyladenosine biosynthesis protein TsaE